jgi:DNA primase
MSDFERVKASLNIQDVITGQAHLKMGKAHLEKCPFCEGHDCFSIPKGKDGFKCFQCDKSGDVFTFLEEYHGLDKAGALQMAADLAGIELEKRKKGGGIRLSKVDKVRLAAVDYYHDHFLKNGGKNYFVEQRGHKPETSDRLRVGFSDGGLLDHLRSQGFEDKDILASGLVMEREFDGQKRAVDFFGRGLVLFPHFYKGRVVHFTQKDPEKKRNFQLSSEFRHKEWRFYNQDALDKFQEILLVEGENDLASVLDAGVTNVIGLIGQISDEQIKALGARARGKKLYLWMDNDEHPEQPFSKGKGYARKICQRLPDLDIRIVVYPDEINDPDDYLRGFSGDTRAEIKRLMRESLDYLSWEILQVSRLQDLEVKLEALKARKVFSRIALQTEIQQQIYIEKLEKLGFSKKALEEQLEGSQDLRQELDRYFTLLESERDADPNAIAEIIYRYFARHGRFYFDGTDTVYLIFKARTFEVANNTAFNSLMHRMTRLLYTRAPGNSVWEALRCIAYNSGRRIDRAQWIYTDDIQDAIYLNFNCPNNRILKISPAGIQEIPNGMNDDHILLSQSDKIMPFNWLPDADIHEGMEALQELVVDNLVCERKQRYFILCWLISGFLSGFAPYQGLMKFSGTSGGGKSTAAKLFTTLLYGDEQLSDPTGAAAYSLAAQNPLLVIDNLEGKDITRTMQKFLLLLATRGKKEKRTSGTESDTTQEAPRALGCITAIEPFTLPELINRTYDIYFDVGRWGSDGFYESDVLSQIKKQRDLILSALLKFIQKDILPNLDQRKDFITVLRREYKGHAKERTNEYLALLMLVLDQVLKYIPWYGPYDLMSGLETGAKEIRQAWIEEQNAKAKDTEVTSNDILKLLDGLVREYLQTLKNKNVTPQHYDGYDDEVFVLEHQEYGLTLIKTKPQTVHDDQGERYTMAHIEFTATSADLVHAFDRFCRNSGTRNPYGNAAVFGSRLKNDMKLLAKGGWDLVTSEGKEPYFRIVRGRRFLKFRHTLVR